ncbi:hypothetical protein GGI12_001298 [Dipsacomyces acuminosporus]|nr:hypothetical protein GGI12_001298 [Dipsacomyces acuminosporus]
MMAPRTNPPLTPSSDKGAQAELDRLQDAVHELQETVAEQKADIKDLEASLRERKAEVRTLRKQLRDKELRQYAVASDYVGLRRTDSIMVETSNFLAQLRAGGECPQRQGPSLPLAKERKITDTEPWTKRRSAVHSIGKSNRKSRVAIDESSGETSTSFTPKRTSTISAKSKVQRRPEKYVNGWSVYEESSSENDKDVEHDKANASARTDADGASQDCHSAVKDSAVNKHDSCISSKMLVSADGSTADRLAKCFEALEAAGDQNAPTLALAATKSTAAPSCIRKTAAAGASRLSVVASIQPVLSLPLPHSEDMHVPSPQRTPVRKNSLSSETKSISHASCRPATSSSAVTDTDAAAPSNSSINSSTTPHILRSVVSKTPRRIYSRLSSRLKKA